jgi:hypothetical protein
MLLKIATYFLAPMIYQTPESSGSVSTDDKQIFVRSYEHRSPTIEQYKVAGVFGAEETPFALSLRFREGQWDVQLESGNRAPVKIRLDKAYNSIPVSRIVVSAEQDEKEVVVMLPFGKPHSECFVNGDEVYSQLAIMNDGKVSLEHFPNCAFAETRPAVIRSRGALLVGPPPHAASPIPIRPPESPTSPIRAAGCGG